jgi:hypothetical protein
LGERENTVTRKRFNVVTIAAMIAILALGSLGVGYAYWTTGLNVTTTAASGTASVRLVELPTSQELVEKVYNTSNSQWETWGSGVPYADCTLTVDAGDPKVATISATQMFPGYACELHALVQNNGTVPIVGVPENQGGAVISNESGVIPGGFDLGLHDCDVIIEPGQSANCHATLKMNYVASEDNSSQSDTYSFKLALKFEQAVPAVP